MLAAARSPDLPTDLEIDLKAKLFRGFADPTRLAILRLLADPIRSCCSRDDGICGCDLEAFLGLTQPTVSHPMKQPLEAGLATAERRGRWVHYEPVPGRLREIAALEALAAQAERTRAEAGETPA